MNSATIAPASDPQNRDEISFVELANAVLRSWRVVALLPISFALLAIAWSFVRPLSYVASASFIPQAAETRGAGGAAALAQQFGVNLGADRPGESPQFYVDLVRSSSLLRRAVESHYEVPRDDGRVWSGTLVQYWELDEKEESLPQWRKAAEILNDAISTSVSQETGVVHFTVSSDHPVLAEQIAQRLLELLNEFNLDVRQSRAEDEVHFISGRIAEAKEALAAAESELLSFLRQNREFGNSPELRFDHDRLNRLVMMRQDVYTSLLRSQEQARIDAVRDIPLFTVIDNPAGTAEPEGRRTVLRALLAFIVGLMLSIFFAFFSESARRSREAQDPRYREFRGLAQEAWDDLRNPRRWLRGSQGHASS